MNDRAAQVFDEALPGSLGAIATKSERQVAVNHIAAYGQEQYQRGVEALRDALFPEIISGPRCPGGIMWDTITRKANRLLVEQEEKG